MPDGAPLGMPDGAPDGGRHACCPEAPWPEESQEPEDFEELDELEESEVFEDEESPEPHAVSSRGDSASRTTAGTRRARFMKQLRE